MRPLETLRVPDCRALSGVIFDVDDTLTTHGLLTPDAYASLFALRDAGLRLIAVTGRPLGWADAFASSWPIELAVGENGAGWARRDGAGLALGYFEDEPTRARQATRLAELRAEVARRMPGVREAADQGARRCDVAFDVAERASLGEQTVAALTSLIESHGARAPVSSVHAHAVFGAWDKAVGATRAARELGVDLDSDGDAWLFVGDSGNDAAAFAHFGTTVGVANVREHLPRLPTPPRYVTVGERGAGFVELARHLVEARHGGA